MGNTSGFRDTNIETGNTGRWAHSAGGRLASLFFHFSETSGEAIRLKGIGSPSPQRSKEQRDETFFQICVGMVGCGFCIGSPAGAGSPEESPGAGSQPVGRRAGGVE